MEDSKSSATRPLRWRLLRWGLIGVAGLITLIALLWAEENWRGKRAWDNFRREWEAKGEKFDLKDFVPPPVPDDQNFAMTPFLRPLYDFLPGQDTYRDTNAVEKTKNFAGDLGDVKSDGSRSLGQRIDLTAWLAAFDGKRDVPPSGESATTRAASAETVLEKMKKYDPVLEELRIASHRPYCRFNVNYGMDNPARILLPENTIFKPLARLYRLRASAELASGRSDAALDDIRMNFYLSDCLTNEPSLLAGLVRLALVNLAFQPVWEGLVDHRWSEVQLKILQSRFEQIDLLTGYENAMRSERGFGNTIMDYMRRARRTTDLSENGSGKGILNLTPSGFFYQNAVVINQLHQELILPAVDPAKHRVYLNLSTNLDERSQAAISNHFAPYSIFAKMLFPAITKSEIKFAATQATVDQADIACALERYRLAHGSFPDKLDALSPDFIQTVPPDLATGEPLKYRRTDDGQFILYSVGWNGVDDGGKVGMRKDHPSVVDPAQKDWVWSYPAPSTSN